MIVQCPRCSTRWRVAEPSATENPIFKCGRCRNVFPRFPGAPPAGERSTARHPSAAPPAADNLEFIFPRRAAAAPPRDRTAASEAPAVPLQEIVTTDARTKPSLGPEHDSADHTLGPIADDASDEIEAGAGAFDLDVDDEPVPSTPSAAARVLLVEDTMSASAPSPAFRPINRTLLALVGLHAVLTLLIRVNPERAGDWFARLPLIGAGLADQPALGREITLRNVRGGYQRLRNARRAFVISGEAVNNSLTTVARIEVEGALYGGTGTIERKIISTGNKTTLKLADLSETEIAMLQQFDPRRTVAPGESVPFSIVFLQPPRDLREFSSRVLTARPTRRTPTAPSMDRAQAPASVG